MRSEMFLKELGHRTQLAYAFFTFPNLKGLVTDGNRLDIAAIPILAT